VFIEKLLFPPLWANKQTIPQSTELLSLNHAVSLPHAHSNTLSLKCLFKRVNNSANMSFVLSEDAFNSSNSEFLKFLELQNTDR
jgi:hypothetical protein